MSAEAKTTGPLMRNLESWAGSLRDFESWVGDSVPGGMDVDFLCERNGKFIILEGKPWYKGVNISWGQHKAMKSLAAIDQFSVYLVGEKDGRFYLMPYSDARPVYHRPSAYWEAKHFIPTDVAGLQTLLSTWWENA